MRLKARDDSEARHLPEARHLAPAVAGAIRILEYLRDGDSGHASLTEIGRELRMSKSTVFGLLRTMEAFNVIEADPLSKRYRLGSGLIRLGHIAASRLDSLQLGREPLKEAVLATGFTGILAKPLADRFLVLHVEESRAEIRATMSAGQEVPLTGGAIGKVVLAFSPPAEAEEKLSKIARKRFTRQTIIDPRSYRKELQATRVAGYSVSRSEYRAGVNAVAAPIFDHSGNVSLVGCLIGLADSMPDPEIRKAGLVLRRTCAHTSRALGFAPAL
jgi:DNA-binding IclR family transcriptional regulator